MNIAQIEESINGIVLNSDKQEFIYNFLLAYGLPKASITRLKKGTLNLAKNPNEVIWKKKLYFKKTTDKELYDEYVKLVELKDTFTHEPRFIIITNFEKVLARDTKTLDTLDIDFKDLAKHFDFFLPFAGMEKAVYQIENPADVKAAEKMAKLYDQIKVDNKITNSEKTHELNVFLTRLLFCFFAEDTDIFSKGIFTKSIESHTQTDGSDLNGYINRLFKVLNLPNEKRINLPSYLVEFPYVNGKLFEDVEITFEFSRKSRQAILECGSLDWSLINPDIFGSMFQGVVSPEYRGSMGMHYTSVPNIMKVIRPLFLDELYEEFEKRKGNVTLLNELLHRLTTIKIFDPACGSGNFLIISYKEIRQLEMLILEELNNIESTLYLSTISLDHFYGIEKDDFAHEIAILSLWLAEHQMNREFLNKFGRTNPTLPLKASGNIISGNAALLEWNDVCPENNQEEVYILGNPPYLGARLMNSEQKKEMAIAFKGTGLKFKELDYITIWFYKASMFSRNRNCKFAFVSTNSITQGEQVALIWPYIFQQGLEIGFAFKSFKWTNNAKDKAGVTCVIIGIRKLSREKKYIFDNNIKLEVSNISPYLFNRDNTVVYGSNQQLCGLPKMTFGSMANDSGYLLLNENEYNDLINSNIEAEKFIKKFMGANEFIKGINRWCLWIRDNDLDEALKIEKIATRINNVRASRSNSKREATKKLSSIPHKFGEIRYRETEALIIPRVSSEKRLYIPIGFLDSDTIISDSALAIYNAEPWLFSLITSKMHHCWVNLVGGKLETRIRYSIENCYNTFPIPKLTDNKKKLLNEKAFEILEVRENYTEKTLAKLYENMPDDLLKVHLELDLLVDSIYKKQGFSSDEERMNHLLDLYIHFKNKEGVM
ncbi:class I SAM-dependent DNA methyltransferase [Ureibacillus aquaedulcis]|uniref:site-specific DNA-methyltransferase (adenine-specific) n=1 Tax=Ureibacillus aquaedulcis TaxID=3058421 RepID=A0ABT8GP65_9BACL|nr:DNA methyltransferase [Ureibacillus sp. BA0131]MDN4493096.1 N-6 DNA methylase [Ureibacillus sp. BA0131]